MHFNLTPADYSVSTFNINKNNVRRDPVLPVNHILRLV